MGECEGKLARYEAALDLGRELLRQFDVALTACEKSDAAIIVRKVLRPQRDALFRKVNDENKQGWIFAHIHEWFEAADVEKVEQR